MHPFDPLKKFFFFQPTHLRKLCNQNKKNIKLSIVTPLCPLSITRQNSLKTMGQICLTTLKNGPRLGLNLGHLWLVVSKVFSFPTIILSSCNILLESRLMDSRFASYLFFFYLWLCVGFSYHWFRKFNWSLYSINKRIYKKF